VQINKYAAQPNIWQAHQEYGAEALLLHFGNASSKAIVLNLPPKAGDMQLVKLPAHISAIEGWSTRFIAASNEMARNEELRKAVARFQT
jgi:hypothetical protein